MLIAKLDDKGNLAQYPYSLAKLRQEHPNTSFPEVPDAETLYSYGVVIVEPTKQPEFSYKEDVVEGEPRRHSGNEWHQTWRVVKRKKAEVKDIEDSLRQRCREWANQKLRESDWSQLPDVALENADEWVSYRQQLRGYVLNPAIEIPSIAKPEAVWL